MKTTLIVSGIFALSPVAQALAQTDEPGSPPIETIHVEGRRNQPQTEVSVETEKLLHIAGIDQDPLNAVFSLPGVVYAGGDSGGKPAIRGSSPQDNAFYVDSMPVGYIFHMFGNSIFNENLVRRFSLFPAAFGAEYGNATGGVFDVGLRDPRPQPLTTTLDVSLLKAGATIEGSLGQSQAFYLSYRRSLIHLFLPEGEEEDGYTVFKAPLSDDYQGKYQWLIGDDQKLTFTLAGASDEGGINVSSTSEAGRIDPENIGDYRLKNRFDSQGLNWQLFGNQQQLFNLSLAHSKEKETQAFGQGQFVQADSDRVDVRAAYGFDWMKTHRATVGIDLKREKIDYGFDVIPYFCTDHDADCRDYQGDRVQDNDSLSDKDVAVYLQDIWSVSDSVELEGGIRAEYNDFTGQHFVHPRLSARWFVDDRLTLSTAAGRYSRFPDVDTLLRKIGNPALKSPEADHYALGLEYRWNDDWSGKIDIYRKSLSRLPKSVALDSPDAGLHYTDDLSGRADGVEVVINRAQRDRWYGWASLSWSKSERTDDLTGVTTRYYLDTPLMANIVANYQLNERWDFGVRFTLRSGQRYTPIVGVRENPDHPGHYLPVYGELNAKTLPVYHRLDLQANYHTTLWGYDAQWTFATINTYGRKNVSNYYFLPDEGAQTPQDYHIKAEKGIGLFPSIGLKMTF